MTKALVGFIAPGRSTAQCKARSRYYNVAKYNPGTSGVYRVVHARQCSVQHSYWDSITGRWYYEKGGSVRSVLHAEDFNKDFKFCGLAVEFKE